MTLDETLAEASALLAAAVTDRESPFRTPALATTGADGAPELRLVVLRAFDPVARHLAVHTDARSAKVLHLRCNPAVAVLAWDARRRLQVRLRGRAALHTGDAVGRAAWDALPERGRQVYRARQAPGSPIADPSAVQDDAAAGFAVFMVLVIRFDRLETLRLADHGQTRARFDFSDAGVAAAWLAP